MKTLIVAIALLVCTGVSAQDHPPVNIKEETKTTTVTMEKDGKLVEKKMSVNTKEVQEVKFDKRDENKLNQEQIPSPTLVTETVMVDNDNDPFYDSKTTSIFYIMEDQQFSFAPNSSGFEIMFTKGNETKSYGKAMKSSSGNHYILRTDLCAGVGFFDNEGNFIFEYFDDKTNSLLIQEYMINN